MAAHVLVVATVTAASDDLLAALSERVRRSSVPVDFPLVMPPSGPAATRDRPRLEDALARWREAGLKAEGVVGDADPVQAVYEVCSPGRFDEVIVSHAARADVALAALGRALPDRRARPTCR